MQNTDGSEFEIELEGLLIKVTEIKDHRMRKATVNIIAG